MAGDDVCSVVSLSYLLLICTARVYLLVFLLSFVLIRYVNVSETQNLPSLDTFVNGKLQWLMSGLCYILVLAVEHDMWTNITLPDEIRFRDGGNRVYLLESDGFLSVIQLSDVWMKIWKMTVYETVTWCVVDRVNMRCIKGLVLGIFPISQTDEYVFLATHKQVLVYQRRSKLWKEIFSVKGSSSLPLWFSAHAFRSTIVPCN